MKKKASKRTARNMPISRLLRKTIREQGLTAYGAAKQAGVSAGFRYPQSCPASSSLTCRRA